MNSPTKQTEDDPSSNERGTPRRPDEHGKVRRPEGDMVVGSTSTALGGEPDPAHPTSPSPAAPVDGTGSVGDGKRSTTNSGTSSTSVGTAAGS